MTSTSVKDVSMVMQSFQTTGSAQARSVKEGGFTEVFNRQTGREMTEEATVRPEAKKQIGHATDAKEPVKEPVSVEEGQTVKEPCGEMPEEMLEDVEKAMEVLGTAAQQVITQLAETFEISEEAVMQVMDEMGMEPVDVLKPDMLGNLMLEIGGAADSMELLTNEALYSNFKVMMEKLNVTLSETATALDITPEELTVMMHELDLHTGEDLQPMTDTGQNPEAVLTVVKAPVIEVVMEEGVKIAVEDSTEEAPVMQEPETREEPSSTMTAKDTQRVTMAQSEEHTADMSQNGGRREAAGNENENVLLAQLRENRLQPQTSQTVQAVETGFAADLETQDIMRQIMDYMRVQIKPDMSNVEMQLHPASLGTLQVQVASEGGVLTAKFVTQSETVKAVLESQMIQLQESFSAQGVKVEAIEVAVQTHQFESNLEQGRGHNQEPQERRSRVRRLIFDGELTMDEIKELNAEELLTARMMEANGNTAEHTA